MRSFLTLSFGIAGLVLIAFGAGMMIFNRVSTFQIKRAAAVAAAKTAAAGVDPAEASLVSEAVQANVVKSLTDALPIEAISKLKPADRLIAWGLVSLILAGVVSGYLDFSVGEAPTAEK
ncbi:hypothetical protein AB0A74_09710 [Saccharothrix sp. NPDC042600]|uniref:hypothetical protein n=1 Tax=Saccharothrix TaxID=2071 RepID=UPI00340BB877|nr:hypothetical protein GCM10017745_35800 [Saccharothrix mutabilis subsp. capreolus]